MEPFFRTLFNYDRNQVSDDTATLNMEPSLTRQEFANDADINVLVERMMRGEDIPTNTTPPKDGDFSELPDFTAATQMIRQAQQVFDALPARIRSRFQNEPQKYIDFFHDPDNYDEALKMGLVKPRVTVDTPPLDPKKEAPKDPSKKD